MLARLAIALPVALLALFLAVPSVARAEVRLPNGEWVDRNEDLRVKVRGGYVVVERTWQAERQNQGEWRWHVNPAWARLTFKSEALADSSRLIAIGRAGATFERTGDDEPVFVFDKHYFIRERADGGWRWYDRKGNWIHYDNQGYIEEYGDRNDVKVSFVHDTEHRLSQVLDHDGGVVLTFAYAANSTTITDRASRQVVYHYTNGNLTSVTDVMGEPWAYEYSGTGGQALMTVKRDPEGRKTLITYTGKRVREVKIGVTDSFAGYQTQYVYDYNRVKRQYTVRECAPDCNFAERRETERRYDFAGTLLEQTTGNRTTMRLLRDGAHVEIRVNERGLRTTTEFDAHRNPRLIRYPDGTQVRMEYEPLFGLLTERVDEAGVITRYDYNGSGNLITQTEALGTPEQRITEYTYDVLGQRQTRTVRGAAPADDATTIWTYDDHGNVASETNPESETVDYELYHVTGQPERRRDARDKLWLYGYDNAGRLLSATDPLENTVEYRYDKVGNRLQVIDALDNATVYTYTTTNWLNTEHRPGQSQGTAYTYYPNPYGELATQTDPDGVVTAYTYDATGRLERVDDGAGNFSTYKYGISSDGMQGLLRAVEHPTYTEGFRYDSRDRRTRVIREIPDPSVPGGPRTDTTVTAYDAVGRVASITDPAGRITRHEYDDLGRLTKTIDPAGGETVYDYDSRDNLLAVTDANGNTHSFVYDRANRLRREERPMGQGIDYTYYPGGLLHTRTNALGQRREFVYDDAGRRTDERHYDVGASIASQSVIYDYDERGLLEGYLQTGDTDSSATYAHNERGEKIGETVTFGQGAEAFTRSIGYDPGQAGRPARFVYPDGKAVDYRYDAGGRLAGIDTPGGAINYLDYDWQQPRRVELPGVVRTLTYDILQRPTQIRVQALGAGTPMAPQGDVLMDYGYTYDAAGNITQRDTEAGPYQYDYDPLDRLTQAVPPPEHQATVTRPDLLPVEGYQYDPVHNRTHSAHQPGAWQYNANNELLGYGLGQDAVSFDYDENGHTVQETKATGEDLSYHYNPAERLSEIKRNGTTIATYHYDPMGRRIRKDANGRVIWFQYSDAGVISEYSQAGLLQRVYGWQAQSLWGTDPVFLADVAITGGNSYWAMHYFHNDHLGTPQHLSSIEGNATWSGLAEAFGKTLPKETNYVDNPLLLPGQYFDREVGFHYNYFRSYRPFEGRYLQSDPLGLRGDINLHAYVAASVTTRIDPLGLCEISGTWRHRPSVGQVNAIPCSASSAGDFIGRCINIDNPFPWQKIKYNVSVSGTIRGMIECTEKCECPSSQRNWFLIGSVEADVDVGVPIPGLNWCNRLPHPALKAACYYLKYQGAAEFVPGAVDVARHIGRRELELIADSVALTNDPNNWCNARKSSARVNFSL